MAAPRRLTVREARDEARFSGRLADAIGTTVPDAQAVLAQGARRIRELLGFRSSPIDVRLNGSVRVDRVAGLIRLTQDVELQVVPKFLDPEEDDWQEDFFLLALFSQTGRILPREQIRAGHDESGDLATLVGRTLAQMYWENRRRPVRTYRTRPAYEFSIDGDADAVDLVLPDPDGFRQNLTQLRSDNEFNSVIESAVRALLPEVRDAETRKQLLRVQHGLAPQRAVVRPRRRILPARHRHWQPTYDLSLAILDGFGVGFTDDQLVAPGFVLQTWTTWQSLVEASLRAGLPQMTVAGQQPYRLGQRESQPMDVKPDVMVIDNGTPKLVVDAKYRVREGSKPAVDAGDIYETLAFMRASGTREALLLYPRPADGQKRDPVGSTTVFEKVTVGNERITGLLVECRGISAANGYGRFIKSLAAGVSAYIP